MELLTTITSNIAHAGIELLEIAAMGILLSGSGKSIWMLIRHRPHVTLELTRYMNIALIMLCAEIIRLVLVRTPLELAIVAGMVALHGAISYLISWGDPGGEARQGAERGRGVRTGRIALIYSVYSF